VTGLGSIGRRHIRNIADCCRRRAAGVLIDAFRSGKGGDIDAGISAFIDREVFDPAGLADHYDAVFITNPTALHYDTLHLFKDKSRAFFIEKPVFGVSDLARPIPALADPAMAYVACPLRYSDVLKYLKERVDLREVIHVRAICSSYLPDWRPGTDYRRTYSASKELGGGVAIDLIHEWDYLHWLFGKPSEVKRMSGKVSALEMDSEDIAMYLAKYEDKTLELHLDYFGREPVREVTLYTNEGNITADILNGTVKRFPSGEITSFGADRNILYEREMAAFFDLVERSAGSLNTIEDAISVMNIAMGRL
jgi:predicted dehydrogenase